MGIATQGRVGEDIYKVKKCSHEKLGRVKEGLSTKPSREYIPTNQHLSSGLLALELGDSVLSLDTQDRSIQHYDPCVVTYLEVHLGGAKLTQP